MNAEHFHYQTRTLQLFQLQGSKRMKQYSWNYQERRRTFPLSLNNTTVSITSRKKKNGIAYLELSRTLENISSVSQEYYNLFNFKKAKKRNNVAGFITKR